MTDLIQQQLVAARKNQILDAATVVFAEKGFHPTTTKDIAKRAGISEGTIYNYFDSKTALLLAIFERMKATVIAENMPPMPEELDLRTFLQTALYHPLMALKQDNFALFRIVVSEMMVNEELRTLYYQQILEPTLSLGEGYLGKQMAKRGHDPVSISLSLRAISGMVLGLMMEHILGDPILEAQWERLPDFLTELLLKGLEDSQA
ncbi:MAG: TetR/AcrR family transcriptional regulator [Chloroflexota bacterium]